MAQHGEPLKVEPEEESWLFRPQEMRTVIRGEVSILGNTYFSAALEEFHGERVRVAYDVTDAQWVWIYDDAGRLICKAEWHGNATSYMPESFIDRASDNRTDQRLKRLDVKRENVLAEKGVAGIGYQETVNIGGINVNLAEARRQHEKLAAEREAVPVTAAAAAVAETPKQEDAGWFVPDTPAERFELYQRLKDTADLPDRAAVWVRRYPNSPEYQSFAKRQAVG